VPTLELIRDELPTLAMALRIAARKAETDAGNQGNLRIRETFSADARNYAALAVRIEGARAEHTPTA